MKDEIDLFEKELKKGDFSNLKNPLYDFSDERVKSVYKKLQKDTKPGAISRDTTSWEEIKECVEEHIHKYGNGALVIIGGAAPHIWGAIPYLEQKVGARYISTTSHKLSIDLLIEQDDTKTDKKTKEREALEAIQVQMKRDLGVVKNLGYNTIEDYLADRNNAQNPKNIIFGAEEQAPHIIYMGKRKDQLYTTLLDFLKNIAVSSILYIYEDLNVENMRSNFEKGKIKNLPRDKVLKYAKNQGISVEFGAFGHRYRKSFENFDMKRIFDLTRLY